MKIGFFTDGYLPAKHGVEASIESFRAALEKMGHEVIVFAPHTPGYKDLNRVFRLKSLSLAKKADLRFSLPIIHEGNLIDVFNTNLDIVHIHTPFNIGFLGKLVAIKQNIPTVYTHHTDYPEYVKIYLKEKIVSPYLAKKLTSLFANYMDAIIAPSEKVSRMLESYKIKRPIHVIPNGVNLEKFRRTEASRKRVAELKAELGLKQNDKIMLFLGRVCEEKNIVFLLNCFEKIRVQNKNAKFVVVGDGTQLEELKNIVKNKKLDDSVIFTGFIAEKDKACFYQLSDVFVFASHTDTQGIVILEAMSSGVPIVALKDGAFEAMAKNNQNAFLIENDSEDLFVEKILELMSDTALHERFSQNSYDIANEFSETKVANRLLALYGELIKKRSDRRTKKGTK